jgi:hypothetical protein
MWAGEELWAVRRSQSIYRWLRRRSAKIDQTVDLSGPPVATSSRSHTLTTRPIVLGLVEMLHCRFLAQFELNTYLTRR